MNANNPPWIDRLTIPQVLDKTASWHANREGVVFPWLNYRRTWDQFRAEVRECARALVADGVGPGEHVGIWATNLPTWLVVQFAAAAAGAVLVNINPAYRAQELEYVINQADLTTLFLTDQVKNTNYFSILESVCPELGSCPAGELRSHKCPRLRRVICIKETPRPGLWNWPEFLARGAGASEGQLDERQGQGQPSDTVNIQYTSGTTGFPKGAMLSHRNLLMNAFYVGERLEFTAHDRLCLPVPFYHCFGCVMGTLMCSIYGSTLVVPGEVFEPQATLQTIHAERCTAVYGVPTMFIAQMNHSRFGEFDLRSLRTGIMAGSPCPIEVMRAVVERMGAREITIAYGLTEASPVITQTQAGDDLEHRVGTVGTVLPGLEVRIVRPGTMEDVPAGEKGELVVRGHGVMKGYYQKPEETAQAVTPDGWLHTGDLAMQTPDSYYRITGRIKDMIIRGGENIYPREIEEYLYTHPQVADVQVVGLPDPSRGEEVCAWIKLRPGAALMAEDIKDYCRDRIAHFKIPRYVVFVDEFPTTVTGKVQKYKLREMGIERFGLEQAARIETA